jgi:hypothetical protein
MMPLQELLVAQANGATRSGHLMLMSPGVLLKNALGFTLVAANVPATTARTWISVAIITFGSLALAAWIFLRAQGVETWEASRPQRWTITLAILSMVIVPVTLADTNYDNPAPKANNAPAIRGVFSRNGINMALVSTGRRAPERCCSTILNRDEWPMPTDHDTTRDLLLFLPVDASRPLSNFDAQVTGENGLNVSADISTAHIEQHTYNNDSGPIAEDGRRLTQGWIARIPVTLNPTQPWDIGGDRYPIAVKASYNVNGGSHPATFAQRAAIDAEVGPAIYQMGIAALGLPLLCLTAAIYRWRATR